MGLIQKVFGKPKVPMRLLRELQDRIGSDPKNYSDHMDWRTEEQKTHFWGDDTWKKYEDKHKNQVH